MVVHNLNVEHVGTSEADPPLVIDPNTVLPFAITGKSFQARNLLEPPAELPREDLLGLLIAKGSESRDRLYYRGAVDAMREGVAIALVSRPEQNIASNASRATRRMAHPRAPGRRRHP